MGNIYHRQFPFLLHMWLNSSISRNEFFPEIFGGFSSHHAINNIITLFMITFFTVFFFLYLQISLKKKLWCLCIIHILIEFFWKKYFLTKNHDVWLCFINYFYPFSHFLAACTTKSTGNLLQVEFLTIVFVCVCVLPLSCRKSYVVDN